jgi:hypothetical protein
MSVCLTKIMIYLTKFIRCQMMLCLHLTKFIICHLQQDYFNFTFASGATLLPQPKLSTISPTFHVTQCIISEDAWDYFILVKSNMKT